VFFLLHLLLQFVHTFIVPICFVSAWTLVLLVAWSAWSGVRDTVARSQRMHQIPCANCQFFTCDYHLKCTVHPSSALTEDAIDCLDYEPTRSIYVTATKNS
jgi:hypothetical protein